jgi:peptidoglycan hydrolase CwlO-like protein
VTLATRLEALTTSILAFERYLEDAKSDRTEKIDKNNTEIEETFAKIAKAKSDIAEATPCDC